MEKKYEVIISFINELIDERKIKQGDRLPSIRELVDRFKCNKSTVIRAYKELELNHKIYSIPKSGYYLVDKKKVNNENLDDINFSEVVPDPKLLPFREFNHCINKAIDFYKESLFTYSDPQGLESLRKVLASHLEDSQIFTTHEKIIVTSGAQQALSILAKMPFPNNKKNILVEQPTYKYINKLVELNGDRLIGINRSYEGINLKELEHAFKSYDIKLFYTIPRFHNPLGTSYCQKDKEKIVELADRYDVYIVEDDYLGDLDINNKSLPLHYYDISERVIYVKSFSKSFMPGIRIGVVALQEKLKKDFLEHKKCFDLNTSVLAQGALEIFINSGMYKSHLRKVRKQYKKKMDFVREYVNGMNTKGVEYFIPETGFFLWISLSNTIDMKKLYENLKTRKIYVTPANEFYKENSSKENSFRVCISKLSENQIQMGLRIIFNEINKEQNNKTLRVD